MDNKGQRSNGYSSKSQCAPAKTGFRLRIDLKKLVEFVRDVLIIILIWKLV